LLLFLPIYVFQKIYYFQFVAIFLLIITFTRTSFGFFLLFNLILWFLHSQVFSCVCIFYIVFIITILFVFFPLPMTLDIYFFSLVELFTYFRPLFCCYFSLLSVIYLYLLLYYSVLLFSTNLLLPSSINILFFCIFFLSCSLYLSFSFVSLSELGFFYFFPLFTFQLQTLF
jgi:hypothetical protein